MQTSSRRFIRLLAGLALFVGVGGCAADRSKASLATTAPAARSAVLAPSAEAALTLDEIPNRPDLAAEANSAATQPSSQPATTRRAPAEALTIYAQAVNALRTGRRFTAIQLLEKAIALDPQSFELNYALGRAHGIGRTTDPLSIAALERAAAINPDNLELQTDLGRQFLASGDQRSGLRHLRLAVQTADYQTDESDAAVADLFLARALQQGGYDRAALEQYARLLRRVQGRTLSLRNNPQLAFLITDRLYVDIGDLYFRNGQFADALVAFEPAARRDPSDFNLETRVVRALVGLQRYDDASRRAADVVVRFRASKQSLDLLREVHQAAGDQSAGAADALARMLGERPADTTILFALVELLREEGRWAQAEGSLAAAFERSPGDVSVLRRWLELRLERDDPEGAARLLVESLASHPDLANEVNELWPEVITPARANRLRLAQLQALGVFPSQSAAKELAVATVAEDLGRRAVVAESLRRAVTAMPTFAPAFRARLKEVWVQRGTDEAEKVRLTDELVAAASSDAALADEIRGLSLLYRKRDKEAAQAFAKAIAAARSAPPMLLLSYAQALRGSGEPAKFEQLMWKLLSDHPSCELAHSTLYAYYSDRGADAPADRVLKTRLAATPDSAPARLLQAVRHLRAGRTDAAEQIVARLVDERADDAEILRSVYAFFSRNAKTDTLIAALERNVRDHPGNLAAVGALVELYQEKGRPPADGVGLLDAASTALADDPDHLDQLAHLYVRAGLQPASEVVLARVLEIEPSHPPASNDLGYTWTERGENLARAEALIRQAVDAEPQNSSFLDSLGWVLYKRGNFPEARVHLEKSIGGDAARADPVVLDHLGDVLYRLGEPDGARKQWEQAGARIAAGGPAAAERAEFKQLKADLDRKTRQLDAGEPVTVSPVVDEGRQAKN
jgi:tetratricopeptide (TPR) repeat protein